MRTRKKKWSVTELENNPLILREASPLFPGGARAFFNDGKPVHLEIGCGKGRFITETACQNPGVRFIAIERDPTVLAAAARLAMTREGENVPLFLVADVRSLTEIFMPGDIARLYINFCDPWPNKKKWAKRRLTHGNFLALYENLLIPEIFFKTDNRPLFEFSVESLSENGWRLKNVSLNLHAGGGQPPEGDVMTEYEQKYYSRGLPIYRLEATKPYEAPQNS